MNGAKVPVKTCYKCKADGHVRSCVLPLGVTVALTIWPSLSQIARDCPEGREPVVEEEEDNTWGEIQEDPWGSTGLPADGSQGMH